jgi:hypothetical protein
MRLPRISINQSPAIHHGEYSAGVAQSGFVKTEASEANAASMSSATCVQGLTHTEKKGISDILFRVRRKFIKTSNTSSIDAWLHLLMGLIYLPKVQSESERRMKGAKLLIDKGIKAIVESLPGKPLLEKSVVLPLEIVSLMSLKLLQDVTPPGSDIIKTYSDFLEKVVSVRNLY